MRNFIHLLKTHPFLKQLITIFLFCILESAFGQNPYYHTIDKSSGLPSNSVYDIFQDSKGFMWFATGKGLCRYDGNTVKTVTADFQTSKSGSCITEDLYGRIWYENFDGYLYYVEKGKLHALQQPTSMGFYKYGIIKNKLFVIQPKSLILYDLKTLKIIKTIPLAFNSLKFTCVYGPFFYVFAEEMHAIDENGNKTAIPFPENFEEEIGAPIVQSTPDGLFIASKYSNNYYLYKKGTFLKNQFRFSTEFIQNVASTEKNNWLCTTKGVIRLDHTTNISKTYFNDSNISFIFMDKQKNYWISTLNNGVYFIENFDTKLYELNPRPIVLAHSETTLFIGTDKDALYKMGLKNNKITSLYKGNSNHTVYQLTYDKPNEQLFFTSSKFNRLKKEVEFEIAFAVKDISRVDSKYYSYAASGVSGIFATNETQPSEWDAVFMKNKTELKPNFNQAYLIPNANGKSTAYNPTNKTIYYATNNGLIAYSLKTIQEVKYQNQRINLTRIKYFNNNLYGVSNNEKVYVVNSSNQIKPFRLPTIIESEKIEKIDLEKQYLYLFSANAVYEVDLISAQFQKIITLTPDIDISDISLIGDTFYFASSKGIIVKERKKNKTSVQPKLIIDDILINDKVTTSDNITELRYDQNNIKINFSTLSYIPNEKHEIFYKINNAKWNKLDRNSQSLILSSLSPDTYIVRLKIGEENNSTIQKIEFTIKNPIWLNPIVLSVFGLVLLLLLYMYYKWQIRKIEKRNLLLLEKVNLEKNLNQSKLKAIKSQMNPHFFYNALNTLQSYILSNDKKQAVNYLSKFSTLTRTILEMTEKETVSVSEEAKTLGLYLAIEKARFEGDFSYNIKIESTVDAESIKIPTMLLQPYVENAVKHGLLHKKGEKHLQILFEKEDDNLKIAIDDNGIGRQKSGELNAIKNKKHQSFATEAMQNRVTLLNQYTRKNITIHYTDKMDKNNQSTGTLVVFEIPITF